MNLELEQLTQKRKKWVEALQENDFDEGIKRLLTDLYPDNAHFIYELLQNAEDPEATEVRFILSDTQVVFEHNGTRLFDLKDVDSITSIGKSTKRDDSTSIGKFGVGFKAVFSYTRSPEIHSGEFHFRICDLVTPETESVNKEPLIGDITRFVLPFDHPNKTSEVAVSEITKGLQTLGSNILLFLKNIRRIDYSLPDGKQGSLERIKHEQGRIEIRVEYTNGYIKSSHWLRFENHVNVVDDDGIDKPCRIAIAYSLIEDDKKKGGSTWKIVPLDHGQVSIFFPPEKETSNLRFHLHAPFASTVARDSVRDCHANDQLRDKLAELVVESLVRIRDHGMLTVGFLAVLPNPADNLPSFYEPIRKAVVSAFKTQALTPTRSGNHAPADLLYRGPARIADVLNDDDLSLLTKKRTPFWAANPPQQNQREDRFLDSLEINTWGWNELASKFSGSKSEEDRKLIEDWIKAKDDAWLMRFYALLGDACSSPHNKKIAGDHLLMSVRVATGENCDMHIFPSYAFFPPAGGAIPPENFYIVKPTVYSSGGTDAQQRSARHFLEYIGVRVFDIKVLAEQRLIDYSKYSSKEMEDIQHYQDLLLFIDCWKENPNSTKLFVEHPFLLDSDKKWREPAQLCLDVPYRKTGFAELAKVRGIYPVWSGYKDKLDENCIIDFIDFLDALGVMVKLDDRELIKLRLERYENPPKQVDENHYDDIKIFISSWAQNPSTAVLFKNTTFLLGLSQEENLCWLKPSQLCLDSPFFDTGLAVFTWIHRNKPIWSGYKDKLTEEQVKVFIDFMAAVGVVSELNIERQSIYNNKKWNELTSNAGRESQYCIEDDYSIIGIEHYISLVSIPCSRLIWNALIKADSKVAKARYRPNWSSRIREADSQFVYHLKNHAWIPDRQGEFCKPQDMTGEDLRSDFPYDNSNGLLTAIGFGENARKRSEDYQARNKKAQDIGFNSVEDAEEIACILKENKLTPKELRARLKQQQRPELPKQSVPNPGRRRSGVLERQENAPTKESVNSERSIQPGIAKEVAEAKAYLRPNYTNSNGELVCQCCREEMPFKIGDAYYFEAVQCIRGLDKHYLENRLALCPTCAAMYRHARQTENAEIRRLIIEHDAPDIVPSVEIPVTLAGKEYSLRFVGKHWFDLKTILGSWDGLNAENPSLAMDRLESTPRGN